MKPYILSLLVSNLFGVLTRVTGLFSRRGYNLKALTVGETQNPAYSRITLVTEGDERIVAQIQKQLEKLCDVHETQVLPYESIVGRELLLLKVRADEDAVHAFQEAGCKILHENEDSIIIEVTADTEAVNKFLRDMSRFQIIEICRTGLTALHKDTDHALTLECVH